MCIFNNCVCCSVDCGPAWISIVGAMCLDVPTAASCFHHCHQVQTETLKTQNQPQAFKFWNLIKTQTEIIYPKTFNKQQPSHHFRTLDLWSCQTQLCHSCRAGHFAEPIQDLDDLVRTQRLTWGISGHFAPWNRNMKPGSKHTNSVR